MDGHTKGISDICWFPNGKYVCTASDDFSCIVFNTETGSKERILTGHVNFVFCVDVSSDGGLIATGSFDETIILWSSRSGNIVRKLPAHSDPVTCVCFSQDGSLLASSSYDGFIRVWDTSSGQCVKTLIDDDNPAVSFVKFAPNGNYILANSLDSTVRLWNGVTCRCVNSFRGKPNVQFCCTSVFVIRDGNTFIASGGEDGCVYIWDLSTKEVVVKLETDLQTVYSVDFNNNILTASGDDKEGKGVFYIYNWK